MVFDIFHTCFKKLDSSEVLPRSLQSQYGKIPSPALCIFTILWSKSNEEQRHDTVPDLQPTGSPREQGYPAPQEQARAHTC